MTATTHTETAFDVTALDDRALWRWIQQARESVAEAWTPLTDSINAALPKAEAEYKARGLAAKYE